MNEDGDLMGWVGFVLFILGCLLVPQLNLRGFVSAVCFMLSGASLVLWVMEKHDSFK